MKKIALILFGILLFTNQIQAQFTLTDSLKAYYPFNNNANDESDNGNDGTVNGAVITTDRFGNANSAYSFNGSNDYIDCYDVLDDVFANNLFTLSAWFYSENVSQGGIVISKRDGTGVNSDDMFGLWVSGNLLINISDNGDNDSTLQYPLNNTYNNKWNHITAIYDRTNTIMQLCLNGSLVEENTNCDLDIVDEPNVHLAIGAEYGSQNPGTKGNFLGIIDNVRIYNRALSESEISQLYANYYPPDTLIAEQGNEQVTLSWDTTNWEYLDKVYIYRDLTLHDSVEVTSKTDTSYTDNNLTNYQSYSYFIRSKDDWGNMSISSDTITTFPCEIVTDYDGNNYKTTKIGNQVWMKESLKTTKYNDGTSIPLVTEPTTWSNLTTPGYCWYNNDQATYKATYGALYNWFTVNTGKLCSTNWHVPSDTEWTTLTDYLGGANVAG